MRIGLTGFAQSGKDEAASVLVKQRGFTKVNMSDALLRDLKILNPLVQLNSGQTGRLADWLEVFSYENLKAASVDFRELLQRYGTDVWRSVDEDTWAIRAARQAAKYHRVVTTGVRFPNEMQGIDVLIHVDRPGYGPINDHVSDTGMAAVIEQAQYRILNDGSIEDLQEATLWLADQLLNDR